MKTNSVTQRYSLRRTILASCLGSALALGAAPVEAANAPLGEFVAATQPAWKQAGIERPSARPPSPLAEQWKLLHPPLPSHPDGGVSHVVTNCNDDGAGSLRAAAGAAVSGDTIDMTSLACSTITLTSGAIVTGAEDLSLIGPGRDQLTVDGEGIAPVLIHVGAGQLYMRGFTVVDGAKYSDDANPAPGGCVYSQGSVMLNEVGVKYCIAQANGTGDAMGGAVYAREGAVLIESTISGSTVHSVGGSAQGGGLDSPGDLLSKYSIFRNNSATTGSTNGFGGAAFVGGDVSIIRSVVHGNTADEVGGLVLLGSTATGNLTIGNSTIADNYGSASSFGAGVYLGANAVISNSTITGNVEANAGDHKYGAGLSAKYGTSIELRSTIVSGNSLFDGSDNLASDIAAAGIGDPPTITGSNNLVGLSTSAMPGDTLFTSDPRLGPLAANGGPTLTMAVLTGSLAFNAGVGGGDYDQRGPGYPRLVGAATDIGAFESDALLVDGFD